MDGIAGALPGLLTEASRRSTPDARLGVSVAGFLDADHTTMYGNANLPLLSGFALKRALEERLDRECVLEVDSNAAVLAEHHYGAGRGVERLLGVTVGTGLGGGVIIQGRLLRYTGECAGDLGHIIVAPTPEGRECTCGARGCLEAMVSSAALVERAGGGDVRGIIAAAGRLDPGARAALADTGRWLGLGLASLSPLFAPDAIVVGGGVASAQDLLLAPTRDSYRSSAAAEFRDRVRIVASRFRGWEGVIGAASLILLGAPAPAAEAVTQQALS